MSRAVIGLASRTAVGFLQHGLPGVGPPFDSSVPRNGDSFGGSIMKQPKISDLVIDRAGTRAVRAQLKRAKTIKITINIDQGSLALLQRGPRRTRVSYQHLLNQVLIAGISQKPQAESRLDRLERELKKLKRRIAA